MRSSFRIEPVDTVFLYVNDSFTIRAQSLIIAQKVSATVHTQSAGAGHSSLQSASPRFGLYAEVLVSSA